MIHTHPRAVTHGPGVGDRREETGMGLDEYTVGGFTFQLSPEDARRLGAEPVTKKAPVPANKSRTPQNKKATDGPDAAADRG